MLKCREPPKVIHSRYSFFLQLEKVEEEIKGATPADSSLGDSSFTSANHIKMPSNARTVSIVRKSVTKTEV